MSELGEDERAERIRACGEGTDSILDGFDLALEIGAVHDQSFGDTVLVGGDRLEAFAVVHCGSATEAGTGNAYVKCAAVRAGPKAARHFGALLDAVDSAGLNLARREAAQAMIERGYRTAIQGVALHTGAARATTVRACSRWTTGAEAGAGYHGRAMSAPDNLYSIFEACFPADHARAFIETPDGRVLTYANLEGAAGRIANLLVEKGLRPGDRVAAQVGKTPEAVFLYLACVKAGLVYVPLNMAYEAAEVASFAADAEPAAFVCTPDTESRTRALVAPSCAVFTLGEGGGGTLMAESSARTHRHETARVSSEDLAAIVYTSGTTGRPKGAMLSHGNLASNGRTLKALWGFGADDVLLHALPIYHVHGLFIAINCVLLSGSAMLFLPRFDAGAVTGLLPRATVMMGVPTFYTRLLGEASFGTAACETMRLFICGSAPLRHETFDEFTARSGHVILERYGMSEAGMITSNPLDGERVGGTVGFALPGVAVRIAGDDGSPMAAGEVGGLEYRGPNLFKGYWRAPDKTNDAFCADGFFRSGDLATMDAAGRVTIVGRSADLIISGGLNVYPKEVERVIDALPGVAECAVVGVPDDDFGEAVAAAIVLEADAVVGSEPLLSALDGRLAKFKLPKRVIFVDALPRNAMGKVQKNLLLASFEAA